MRLLNRTKCPDKILEKLLRRSAAAFRKGTGLTLHLDRRLPHHNDEPGGVVVQFTQRRNGSLPSGCCWESEMAKAGGKWYATDGGWMRIGLPAARFFSDSLKTAEKLWEVLLHEWGHIADYQSRAKDYDRIVFAHDNTRIGGRRPNWEDRPEEIRAEQYKRKSARMDDGGDVVLDWALWFDPKVQKEKSRVEELQNSN